MSAQPLRLTIRGARGSAPTPSAQMLRYGGHTTCLEMAFSPRHRLVLDYRARLDGVSGGDLVRAILEGVSELREELPQELENER